MAYRYMAVLAVALAPVFASAQGLAPDAAVQAARAHLDRNHATYGVTTTDLAHLIVTGERRDPGSFLRACTPGALGALSQAVVESDATFGLFTRYVDWDGVEPEPSDDSAWADAGYNPDSGRWNTSRGTGRDASGLPHTGGGGPGFGGGDGGGFG